MWYYQSLYKTHFNALFLCRADGQMKTIMEFDPRL